MVEIQEPNEQAIKEAMLHNKFFIRTSADPCGKVFKRDWLSGMTDSEMIYWCGRERPDPNILITWHYVDHPADNEKEISHVVMEMKMYVRLYLPDFYQKYKLVLI